ncbi:autoinducer binding domain-containing protein [Pseudomonas atagonensis]|uniref:autoinducer binding domain-containing protein n=1 Tax=Pseudomonas atagonensis TaxID=2609964 RepID=UPI00140E8A5C|nr:autoinducer binding domain-containing protein [Pseudomonas atagonensis]
MERWKELQLKQLTRSGTIKTAYPILLSFANKIGFNFCAITVTSTCREQRFDTLEINNFSKEWNEQYKRSTRDEVDPVLEHCRSSMLPFIWNEAAYARAPKRWQILQREGLYHGWSQSFENEERRVRGTLSLARQECPISPFELYEHFGYLFYVTHHLTDLVANSLPNTPTFPRHPHLSQRELEVLRLTAVGKTACDISRILSLSERTVNYHVQNVIVKFNVCNKISAVIAATRQNLI